MVITCITRAILIVFLHVTNINMNRAANKVTLQLERRGRPNVVSFIKSNGITEGFHRKMKLIQRRAYSFRNFENYRVQ